MPILKNCGVWPVTSLPVLPWSGPNRLRSTFIPRRVDVLSNGFQVETQAHVLLASASQAAGTTAPNHSVYFDKKAALIWEVEEYTTPSGITALLPLCTSNGKTSPWLNSYAFFEQNGIFYSLAVNYPNSFEDVDDAGAAAPRRPERGAGQLRACRVTNGRRQGREKMTCSYPAFTI